MWRETIRSSAFHHFTDRGQRNAIRSNQSDARGASAFLAGAAGPHWCKTECTRPVFDKTSEIVRWCAGAAIPEGAGWQF
jgi:hypothetical protein